MTESVGKLTESFGDVFAIGLHVFDREDGEHQFRVIFGGPVDYFLAFGHFGEEGLRGWKGCCG